jgi:hypothetical protein
MALEDLRAEDLRAEDLARKVYCKHSTNTVNFLALAKMSTVSIVSHIA